MPSVGGGKALSRKHVTQMAAAAGALDLGSHTVGVRQPVDGSRHLLIEGWPATMSVKLVIGSIKLSIAPPADIHTFLIGVVVLPRERPFRALSFDYVSLLRRKRIVS